MEWAQGPKRWGFKDKKKACFCRKTCHHPRLKNESVHRTCCFVLVLCNGMGPKGPKRWGFKAQKKACFCRSRGHVRCINLLYIIYTYVVLRKFWPHTFYEQREKACFCRKKGQKIEHFFQKMIKNHEFRIYTALFSGLLGSFFNGFL